MFEHFDQLPALQTAQWPGFFHSNEISNRALIVSIVRVKLFGSLDDLTKLWMRYPTNNGDDDRLIHFVGYDLADPSFPKMPLRKFRLLRLRSRRRGSTFRMHSLLIHFTISSASESRLGSGLFLFSLAQNRFNARHFAAMGAEHAWFLNTASLLLEPEIECLLTQFSASRDQLIIT
jgi:hypothetical protein